MSDNVCEASERSTVGHTPVHANAHAAAHAAAHAIANSGAIGGASSGANGSGRGTARQNGRHGLDGGGTHECARAISRPLFALACDALFRMHRTEQKIVTLAQKI
eukprot:282420-Pleurochrysis_carterae.AAC.1